MTTCIKIQGKKRQVCSGDLDRWITIQQREIKPSSLDGDYQEAFTEVLSCWALVETKNGLTIFDGTNTERIIDSLVYITFIPNITAENWLLIDGERYKIARVENLDKRSEFLCLYAMTRGTDTNSVNAQ